MVLGGPHSDEGRTIGGRSLTRPLPPACTPRGTPDHCDPRPAPPGRRSDLTHRSAALVVPTQILPLALLHHVFPLRPLRSASGALARGSGCAAGAQTCVPASAHVPSQITPGNTQKILDTLPLSSKGAQLLCSPRPDNSASSPSAGALRLTLCWRTCGFLCCSALSRLRLRG